MATVIQEPRDTRFEDVGNALASSVDFIMQEKVKRDKQKKTATAMQRVARAPNYTSAFQELMNVDPDALSDPQKMAAYAGVLDMAHGGTKPATPAELEKIAAILQAAQSRITSAETIAQAARTTTEEQGRLNREQQRQMPGIREEERGFGKTITDVMEAGAAADKIISTLDVIDPIVKERRVKSGPMAPLALSAVGVLNQLGIDNDQINKALIGDPAGAVALQSAHAKLTLGELGGRLGSGMSDADREMTSKVSAGLGTVPEGNEVLSIIARAQANKNKMIASEVAKMQQQGVAQRDINARITELKNATNVITPEIQARIDQILQKKSGTSTPSDAPTGSTISSDGIIIREIP